MIAGAGLVGLALAPALARAGPRRWRWSTARRSRRRNTIRPRWDARVYAISPGSATFLRALGAWQMLPPERIDADRGDAGRRRRRRDARLFRLRTGRARAGVDRRGARAARGAAAAGLRGRRRRSSAGRRSSASTWTADDGHADARRARRDRRERWRRGSSSAPTASGRGCAQAAGIVAEPKPYGQTAVVANFACERAHHGVARQWFRADGGVLAWLPLPGRRISIVWSAPDALAAELLRARRPTRWPRAWPTPGERALGDARRPITAAAAFPLAFLKLPATDRASAGARRRRRARRPSAGRPGRQPGLRRRAGAGAGPGRARAGRPTRAPRSCSNASPAGGPNPCWRCRRSPTAWPGCSGRPTPWLQTLRNAGLAAVDRLPLLKRALAQPALR